MHRMHRYTGRVGYMGHRDAEEIGFPRLGQGGAGERWGWVSLSCPGERGGGTWCIEVCRVHRYIGRVGYMGHRDAEEIRFPRLGQGDAGERWGWVSLSCPGERGGTLVLTGIPPLQQDL